MRFEVISSSYSHPQRCLHFTAAGKVADCRLTIVSDVRCAGGAPNRLEIRRLVLQKIAELLARSSPSGS